MNLCHIFRRRELFRRCRRFSIYLRKTVRLKVALESVLWSIQNLKGTGILIVSWKCTRGHNGIWESSAVLGVKRGQKVYAAKVLLAVSIVVSGNNFNKLSMLIKFLNVSFLVRKYIFLNSDDVCDPSCKGTVGSNESKGVGGP